MLARARDLCFERRGDAFVALYDELIPLLQRITRPTYRVKFERKVALWERGCWRPYTMREMSWADRLTIQQAQWLEVGLTPSPRMKPPWPPPQLASAQWQSP